MSCGKYSIMAVDGNCFEKTLNATICRNCLRYYGSRIYQSGTNCTGEPSEHFCNGDCEYDSINGTCSLKTGEILKLFVQTIRF